MNVTDPDWLKAELRKPGRSQMDLARYMRRDPSAMNRLVNGGRQLKAQEIAQVEAYLAATAGALSSPAATTLDVRPDGKVHLKFDRTVSPAVAAKILALLEEDARA